MTNKEKIPFNYKELTKESDKRFPNAVWEANAFRMGAIWAIQEIFKDKTREEIIREMEMPIITCDNSEGK